MNKQVEKRYENGWAALGSLLAEQAKVCFVFPLWITAHLASHAEVRGLYDCNAHTTVGIVTHLEVQLLPFLSE
jgi:hypothetical protein